MSLHLLYLGSVLSLFLLLHSERHLVQRLGGSLGLLSRLILSLPKAQTSATLLLELGDILLHRDVQAFEKKVGHDQAEGVRFSKFEEVASLTFEVFLVLTVDLVHVLLEEGLQKFFPHVADSVSLSLSPVESDREYVLDIELLSYALSNVDLEGASHLWELLLHARVPMVLDGVVSAALKDFGDLGPFVAVVAMHQVQDPLLLLAPADLLDLRIQVVVPSLAALLPNSPREVLCDQSPLLRTILIDQVQHHSVLFLCPRTLDKARIEDLLPPVQALDVSAPGELLCDLFPIFASVFSYGVGQVLVL